ncbi:hypothetical protein [Phaeobacter sp.]|uniref:DUF7742 family protein n=1 Tax=Phaeobacter sp. TaxID=1902409 RepID=UPI0025FC73E3|nr:hypothetical protein [Phaeobacter sp.]
MRRPVLPIDVSSAARALLAVAPAERAALCDRIFAGAAQALRHHDRSGRCCRLWGDGSLSAAARRFALAPEPFCDDPAYLQCTLMVLAMIQAHHSPAAREPAH